MPLRYEVLVVFLNLNRGPDICDPGLLFCLFSQKFSFYVHTCRFSYQTMYFDQQVDHFSQIAYPQDTTFKQRVLINTDHFNSLRCKDKGQGVAMGGADCPIFFYSGNEGPITSFYDNSGFIMELAAQYKVN